jgi:putative transposase
MGRFKKLSHTVWECKYHVVWIPKFRYRVLQGDVRYYVRDVIRELCRRHKVEILEGNVQQDHLHLVLSIPPSYCVSKLVGYLKGKSAIQLFHRFGGMRKKYFGKHFWSRGYAVSTVGLNEEMIRKYVRWQQRKDQEADQLSLPLD